MARMFDHYNDKYGATFATQTTSSYNVPTASSVSWQIVLCDFRFNYASSSSSSRSELENYFDTNFSMFFVGSDGNIYFNNFDLLNFL